MDQLAERLFNLQFEEKMGNQADWTTSAMAVNIQLDQLIGPTD